MKIRNILLLCLCVIPAVLTGCSPAAGQPEEEKETVKIYYATEGNETLKAQERQITFTTQQEKYERTVEELLKDPEGDDLNRVINRDTRLRYIGKEGKRLAVAFNEDFEKSRGSLDALLSRISVVNTLTQFDEIDAVRIMIEKPLVLPSGEPMDYTPAFDLSGSLEESVEVKLYFGSEKYIQDIKVAPETRQIKINTDTSREEIITEVLDLLIEGPREKGHFGAIPEGTKVRSVSLEGDTVTIDFSGEMYENHPHGAAGEAITLSSLANTLTELEYVKEIYFTIDGEIVALEHFVPDVPLERMENAIVSD